MTKPITPSELDGWKQPIPAAVFEVFNRLILDKWNGHEARITQVDALNAVMAALNISSDEVFKMRYLDVEKHYREAGWKVVFDKPGYNESYSAYFRFTK